MVNRFHSIFDKVEITLKRQALRRKSMYPLIFMIDLYMNFQNSLYSGSFGK